MSQYEEHKSFNVVLAQIFAKLGTRLINNDINLMNEAMSILSEEFYEDQIRRMGMNSQVESKAHLKGILEKFIHEEETYRLLEDKEAYVTSNLSSSILLSYTLSTNPYFPPTPPSPYFVIYKLKLTSKFSYQVHHSKTSQVGATGRSVLNHAML